MGDEFEMIAAVAAETEAEEEAVRTALDQEFQLSREENLTAALLAGDVELAVQLAVQQGRSVSLKPFYSYSTKIYLYNIFLALDGQLT